MKFVAHRGESQAAPENTLESFTLAWMRGAKCIEGDFHLSKDGHVVCMHDSNALRTCGVDRGLGYLTLAEIKALDCGSWKGEAWRYTRVPTLEEVLRTMPPYGEIFLELKSIGPILDRLQEIFDAVRCRPEQVTFIAFDAATIAAVKRRFPGHLAYWLTSNGLKGGQEPDPPFLFSPDELVDKIRELGVDGVDAGVNVKRRAISKPHIDALKRAKLACNIWTVDDPAVAAQLVELGVDSITTHRCYALRNELASGRY